MDLHENGVAAINGAMALVANVPERTVPVPIPEGKKKKLKPDHFIREGNIRYAGRHFLIDHWDGRNLRSVKKMAKAMRDAAQKAGATVLHIHLHKFGDGGGITGVAILAESHISVHTWPEEGYAAFDVFMCGKAKPELARAFLDEVYTPKKVVVGVIKRGVQALRPATKRQRYEAMMAVAA